MSKLVYPGLLIIGILIPALLMNVIENKGLVALLGYISFLMIIIIGERLFPYKKDFNKDDGDTWHDLAWSFLGAYFPLRIVQATFTILLAGIAAFLSETFNTELWPSEWPLWLQVALCFVTAEFFGYWAHRFRHEKHYLWRFHALHHSPHRLYFLNTARFHPVDMAVGQLFIFPFMVILNVPAEVIFWNTILFQTIGLLSHCNIKFDQFWIFRMLFNTDEHHRWHHSKVIEESNSNYAPSFILWDIVFGTFFTKPDHSAPEALGVTPEYPTNLKDQLLEPFRASRWKKW
jgi:sterol desaturase/sphingolipid hydroxylase (fatty acid hydroxylase superfamily)